MNPYDLFALGAAACWALGSVMSVTPSRHLGAFAFTRWRMTMVAVMLWAVVAVQGSWHSLDGHAWGVMAVSGLVGIFIGDTALFSAMNRLGPRRAGVLFATHAAFSAALGFALLDERMSLQALLGGVLTLAGVMLAIVLGRHKDETHAWEADHGQVRVGVALALLAALCQAVGSLIAKPVMAQQVDPIMASAVRVSGGHRRPCRVVAGRFSGGARQSGAHRAGAGANRAQRLHCHGRRHDAGAAGAGKRRCRHGRHPVVGVADSGVAAAVAAAQARPGAGRLAGRRLDGDWHRADFVALSLSLD